MVHLKDYKQPDFWIRETKLFFDLRDEHTRVRSILSIEKNTTGTSSTLRLDGEELELVSLKVDGQTQTPKFDDKTLLVDLGAKSKAEVAIEVVIEPQKNLACEGLYKSASMFCTQCEAESFRRITYYVDRPDVMSVFTVTIEADKAQFPTLLSNGNRISSRDRDGGRHEAVWHDPFKKPAYLFALVAGNLGCLRDTFKTHSGRNVALEIFCRKGLEKRCEHAMVSLKNSMKWDEERFGLEYDLDTFMIVVADDFNMGAMENKGLNIFNANYILAEPATATDKDYNSIEAVVGHEYFHNWTGNRITCRDWFQLSLKEGLTVYRDQEFSSDMRSRAVTRIDDVIRLRTHQFAEDAGPMAHPVRPQSYISIDNFYTITVYEKGAEVIRMIETLIGRDAFRKGMDKYFELFDGQAVTTEDFVHAMELGATAAGVKSFAGADVVQFKNWYDQAGTPLIKVTSNYEASKKQFVLTLEQSCKPTPGQATKKPFLMPIAIGLLGKDSKGHGRDLIPTKVLVLKEPKQTFVIDDIGEKPVLSFLRGFSAPVKVEREVSVEDTAFLIAYDSDPTARWEAAQDLMLKTVIAKVEDKADAANLEKALLAALKTIIDHADKSLAEYKSSGKVPASFDPALASLLMLLPSENYVAQSFKVVDVDAIYKAHTALMTAIAQDNRAAFTNIYENLWTARLSGLEGFAMGARALRNTALAYLCTSDEVRDLDRALEQRRKASDMTTELGALEALNRSQKAARTTALDEFKEKWRNETLVMNKWLTIRAVARRPQTLSDVKVLLDDPVFDRNNPNKIYSLLLAFAHMNTVAFHLPTGEGYSFVADQVLDIDTRNPQVASRLVSAFNQWKLFDPSRQTLMKKQLDRIAAKPGLSNNVAEIVGRALS